MAEQPITAVIPLTVEQRAAPMTTEQVDFVRTQLALAYPDGVPLGSFKTETPGEVIFANSLPRYVCDLLAALAAAESTVTGLREELAEAKEAGVRRLRNLAGSDKARKLAESERDFYKAQLAKVLYFAVNHHQGQAPYVLLHSLEVDIPAMCSEEPAPSACPRDCTTCSKGAPVLVVEGHPNATEQKALNAQAPALDSIWQKKGFPDEQVIICPSSRFDSVAIRRHPAFVNGDFNRLRYKKTHYFLHEYEPAAPPVQGKKGGVAGE
jgi:hypothetical protein